jgi:hypothetical protein
MKELKGMKKEELEVIICDMEEVLILLEERISKGKNYKRGRKEILLDVLKNGKSWSIKDLSEKMGVECGVEISRRNISSLLSYLRDDFENDKDFIKYDLVKIGRGNGKLKLIIED